MKSTYLCLITALFSISSIASANETIIWKEFSGKVIASETLSQKTFSWAAEFAKTSLANQEERITVGFLDQLNMKLNKVKLSLNVDADLPVSKVLGYDVSYTLPVSRSYQNDHDEVETQKLFSSCQGFAELLATNKWQLADDQECEMIDDDTDIEYVLIKDLDRKVTDRNIIAKATKLLSRKAAEHEDADEYEVAYELYEDSVTAHIISETYKRNQESPELNLHAAEAKITGQITRTVRDDEDAEPRYLHVTCWVELNVVSSKLKFGEELECEEEYIDY